MYKDIEFLFANPVLFLLIIVLADNIFQDYRTFKEIKAIPLSINKSLYYFRIRK